MVVNHIPVQPLERSRATGDHQREAVKKKREGEMNIMDLADRSVTCLKSVKLYSKGLVVCTYVHLLGSRILAALGKPYLLFVRKLL